jgi:hypothetical protein
MADTKISALPNATALFGTEPVPIVQGGATVQTTVQDIADLASVSSVVTPLTIQGTASATGEVRLSEDTDDGANYVALKAPTPIASNVTWTLPAADGTSGQVLATNGTGTWSYVTRVQSDATGVTGADAITNVISLNQAEYDAIGSKSATTLYVITP